MARPVTGFISEDGTFFPFAEDCELYEAERALEATVVAMGADPKRVFIVCDGAASQIRRYLDAKQAYYQAENAVDRGHWADRAAPFGKHHTGDIRAEADNAGVQQQPAGSGEHVPDVGSSVGTEAISNDSQEHGSGVRSTPARSVRSRPYMATTSVSALNTARNANSEQAVRVSEK